MSAHTHFIDIESRRKGGGQRLRGGREERMMREGGKEWGKHFVKS